MASHYMRKPAPNQGELAIKNLMANLERAQGVPTANSAYVEAQHKMLELYLNGGPRVRV